MSIFVNSNGKLQAVKEKKFDQKEEFIQKLTEKNLEVLFGLKFVSGKSNQEFTVKAREQDFRIDTLAYDEQSKSLVVIEYKKDRNFSVIDQGFSYLSAMLQNKAEFVLELNRRLGLRLDMPDIDWEQSRLIFISPEFTNYQKNAINFKDLPFSLYEVRSYENGLIEYDEVKAFRTSSSIQAFTKDKLIKDVSRQVRVYSLDDHFKPGWEASRELFENLRSKVLALDPRIEEKVNKFYIGFKIGFYNVCGVHAQKSGLRVDLVRVDKKDLKDPEGRVKKVEWKKLQWGKLASFYIETEQDIDYAMFLIKQVYEKFYT